jgi:hypothetical protein
MSMESMGSMGSRPSLPVMTPAEVFKARVVFHRDQAAAAELARRRAAVVSSARLVVALYLLVGVYAVLAVTGHAPVAPWSPLG